MNVAALKASLFPVFPLSIAGNGRVTRRKRWLLYLVRKYASKLILRVTGGETRQLVCVLAHYESATVCSLAFVLLLEDSCITCV